MTRRHRTWPQTTAEDKPPDRLSPVVLVLVFLCVGSGLVVMRLAPDEMHTRLAALVAVAFTLLVALAARVLRQPLTPVATFFIIFALTAAVSALLTQQDQPAHSAWDRNAPGRPLMTEIARPTHTPAPPTQTATATRTRTPTATATPVPPGGSRANPLAPGQTADVAGWQAVVLAVERGDSAWQRIRTANAFNKPAPEGQEYVLATVRVAYTGVETAAQPVSAWHWFLTGSRFIRYAPAGVVTPRRLEGQLFAGGWVEGDIAFLAGADETNLMLVYAPRGSSADGTRYLAAEPGATLTTPAELATLQPDQQGTVRSLPVSPGRTVTTRTWQATVLESRRGDAAWQAIKDANSAARPAESGYEYVLAFVRLRYVNPAAGDNVGLTTGLLRVTGERNVIYPAPAVPAPAPTPASFLYAGGETSGWVIGQAAAGEGRLLLVLQPSVMSDTARFLALDK